MAAQGSRLGSRGHAETGRAKLTAIGFALALLAGCSTAQLQNSQSRPAAGSTVSVSRQTPATGDERAPDVPAPRPAISATNALLTESEAASADGDYDAAIVSLERALRIDPNDPRLWIALAETHSQLGDTEQATTLAQKALTLSGGDEETERRARRLGVR